MPCDLYFGRTYAESPPVPYWENRAITIPDTLKVGDVAGISVRLKNHGLDDAINTIVELFWCDPCTGIPPSPSRIGASEARPVAHRNEDTDVDGCRMFGFTWPMTSDVVAHNGGNISILARATCESHTYHDDPTTDKLSAIYNVHISDGCRPSSNRELTYRDKSKKHHVMSFAFAATNTLQSSSDTNLKMRLLSPTADLERVKNLLHNSSIQDKWARSGYKIATPNRLSLGFGRERLIVPMSETGDLLDCQSVSRLGRSGTLDKHEAELLLVPGENFKHIDRDNDLIKLSLLYGEMHQIILQTEMSTKEEGICVVEIQQLGVDNRSMGGLDVVFDLL